MDKMVIVRSACQQAGLYGCEASHVDESALAQYTSRLAKHLVPSTIMASNAMAYTVASDSDDDPNVHILTRRVTMLRRMIAKWPHFLPRVVALLQAYQSASAVGILYQDLSLSSLAPAPPPGAPDRHRWKMGKPLAGPIGLVLQSLHYVAAAIDPLSLVIHCHTFLPMPILQVPWQHLHGTLNHIAVRARNLQAATTRTILRDQGPISKQVVRAALKDAKKDASLEHAYNVHEHIVRHISSLGAICPATFAKLHGHQHSKCKHCQAGDGSIYHVLWECQHPLLVAERQRLSCISDLHELIINNSSALPPTIMHGLPPELCLTYDSPFWAHHRDTGTSNTILTNSLRCYKIGNE